jgi:hypothetical protein
MYPHHWPLHTGPSPTTNCQSPQLTHRSEVHDGAAVANTRRRVSLLCVNLPPQPGAGNLPQGSAASPYSFGEKLWWSTPFKANGEPASCYSFLVHGEGHALSP